MWAKYNTSTRVVRRLKVLLNNIDNAINSLIKPTAAANHEAQTYYQLGNSVQTN
jgi:hypothetical protein